jgi:hypothetical protein
MDWIYLVQDRDQLWLLWTRWWAFAFHKMFLSSWATGSFSRTQLHGLVYLLCLRRMWIWINFLQELFVGVVQERTETRTVSRNLLKYVFVRRKHKPNNPILALVQEKYIISVSQSAFRRPLEQLESKSLKVKALCIYCIQFVFSKLRAGPMRIKSEISKVLSPLHSCVNREYVLWSQHHYLVGIMSKTHLKMHIT